MSKPVKSLFELRSDLKKVKSVVSDDTIFSAKGIMFLAEKMDSVEKLLITLANRKVLGRRHPSAYQIFFGSKIKAGFVPKEIGKMWKDGMRK